MISANARCVVSRVPIASIRVTMVEPRDLAKVAYFVGVLRRHPEHDHSFLVVAPDRASGTYVLQDGHHRFVAHIVAGRADALCVVVEEPTEEQMSHRKE